MKIWRLKKGGDRRLRQGHPWAFAGELAHSAKEISPGEIVELRDHQDHFLAYGHAHPTSQICFRKLTSRARETDVDSVDFFRRRLQAARELRRSSGFSQFSHRWCYAEADGLPGLIIDAFLVSQCGWVVVVQASTAGMQRALPQVFEAVTSFASEFGELHVVEAPNSRSRALEGLEVGDKRLVFGSDIDLRAVEIRLKDELHLTCDLFHGQKTGFFLDQQWNASLLKGFLRTRFREPSHLRVLDICCYVGQWAAHAGQTLKSMGHVVEVALFDSSVDALSLAERNLRSFAEPVHRIEGDALKDLAALGESSGEGFDVVICDPPAFVKKKADLEAGLRAYVKINRDAMKLVKSGGVFVSSSCSGLVKAADFQGILREASAKSGRLFQQLLPGGHGPDHPLRAEFPEGEYLKCAIGRVDYPY